MLNKVTGSVLVIIIVLGLAVFSITRFCEDDWCYVFPWQKASPVVSFEDCSARGLPVLESFPRQCTANGKTFVESVDHFEDVTGGRVVVKQPASGSLVTSPLQVLGSAPGTWFFEGSFPISVIDEQNHIVAEGVATARGEWMTEEPVVFQSVLTFKTLPSTGTGYLVLKKDNPSGLPEKDEEVRVVVKF